MENTKKTSLVPANLLDLNFIFIYLNLCTFAFITEYFGVETRKLQTPSPEYPDSDPESLGLLVSDFILSCVKFQVRVFTPPTSRYLMILSKQLLEHQ